MIKSIIFSIVPKMSTFIMYNSVVNVPYLEIAQFFSTIKVYLHTDHMCNAFI